MPDDEMIARIINPYAWEKESNDWEMTLAVESLRNQSLETARNILAAIGDRLLPELPEWASYVSASWMGTDWLAQVSDYPHGVDIEGGGDTPAAAIRNALEADQ